MRPPRALFVFLLALLISLISGCGDSPDDEPRSESGQASLDGEYTDRVPSEDAVQTCDADCRAERRAEYEAKVAERCRALLDRVSLTYRITATPSAGGNEIGLHMTLENESEVRLAGSTGGVLQVSPGPKSNQINWGGSSADELYQKPGTTTSREVWHDRQPPGWHPVGDRVTSFSFYTYTYAPGPRHCGVPPPGHGRCAARSGRRAPVGALDPAVRKLNGPSKATPTAVELVETCPGEPRSRSPHGGRACRDPRAWIGQITLRSRCRNPLWTKGF